MPVYPPDRPVSSAGLHREPSRYRGGMPDPAALVRYEAAGLYEPGGQPGAADRLALLEYLEAAGGTVEQMVEFEALGRLPSLAGLLRRRRGRTLLTPRAVAEQGPFDLEAMATVFRAPRGSPRSTPTSRS